ncbi:alpha/beta fold hydrolase [Oceaniglobus roseus]|uniref:alpha/beta fold hydrolase n=1 Tax=Oceaniglobus roseus TaxID=1737570 RepID=UPI000C7EB3BD|nr:alpha/beta hydrolase [Kandeliimicrobium roseum]
MPRITSSDGTGLHVKDWGSGRPVVLIHGWPLNADSWEHQALSLAEAGFRVVSYDRRGFGRSDQPFKGYDYDTMADDLAAVIGGLDLRDVTLAGFSMGGGEVARYMSRHGSNRIAKAVLVSSIAPFMGQKDNPDGVPDEVFEGMKKGVRTDRAGFLKEFFNDFVGQGTKDGGTSEAARHWMWSMAMMASPKATLDCIDAFAKTDLRGDMAAFDVPTLVVHGTGDKIVPFEISGKRASEMVKGATLKTYEGGPHAVTATHAGQLSHDLVAFAKG